MFDRDTVTKVALIYGLLGVFAAIVFVTLFINVPVGTEARDYVFFHGYLAQSAGWIALFYPVGINQRLVSMVTFALSRDACGLNTPCLNGVQIVLLLLCLAMGTMHLHQLLRRPVLVAICMGVWCLSLPVFDAGFWQATQHDKLAFLFAIAGLSLGLAALRRRPKGLALLAANLALFALFVLALNAKEIAFFLPAAAIAQILLLAPAGAILDRVRDGFAVYALPLIYAVIYIGIYLLRMKTGWQGHVMGGDPATNIAYYALSLMGRQHTGLLISCIVLAVLAVSGCVAAMRTRQVEGLIGGLAYLLVILGANLVLVLRAQYPDNFYLLVADWAFIGEIGSCYAILSATGRPVRYVGFAAIAVLALVFLHKRSGDMFGWGSGELLREAHALNAGYTQLKPYCGERMSHGVKFVFTEHPLGQFYFFRGGKEGPDQFVGSFICADGSSPPMAYSYDGNVAPDHAGQLVVLWNPDLSIRVIAGK